MGNDVAVDFEELPPARTIKVHAGICLELLNLVVKVVKVVPEIEATRPGCSSGIEALCMLNSGIVKAKSLLQHCSESSSLYLALTGDAILSRCKKSRNILEQSLSQIQDMVPVSLAVKISGTIVDLRSASLYLDPLEEEAGKLLRELLHGYGSTTISTEETTLRAIQMASSQLHITSQKSLLIEKRSIKKLLDKIGESDPNKRKILLFFLNLLRKFEKYMKEQKDHDATDNGDPHPTVNPYRSIGEVDLRVNYRSNESEFNMLSRPVPPEEFMCPLSSRLMHDPVVIASGQTYERAWIQKWFDEGNDTCPKTNMKLAHLSFTSNMCMKDLILKWCKYHNVSFPDGKIQEKLVRPWETSMNSIASLSSSMNDLNLPLDFSNVSIESTQSCMHACDVQSSSKLDSNFLSKFSSLPWNSQCNAVENVRGLFEHVDESENIATLLLGFLKNACECEDLEAQMNGCLLFLEFVQQNRAIYVDGDSYVRLASFLDTEAAKPSLSIFLELSMQQNRIYEIQASGALFRILNILESQVEELLEPALTILSNLSSNSDFCSFIVPSEFVPRLIPHFQDCTLARHCMKILNNLCDNPGARSTIAETDGCIPAVVKLIESDSHEEQEQAVCVVLSLCSQRVEYCQLVMDEGVIPGLVNISVNGNKKGKAMALELLRILKDEISVNEESPQPDVVTESTEQQLRQDHNLPPKSRRFFGRIFGKNTAASANKKR